MLKLIVISCVLVGSVLTEQVKFQRCQEQSNSQCTISNVMITPCPEAAENLPCRVKKGRSVSIDFDFTPEFAMDTIHSQAYWAKGDVDLPLIGMENDGCKSTTCPVAERATQSYHWTFDVDKKFPTRQFNVKMKMKNQQEDFCCFIFSIRLTK